MRPFHHLALTSRATTRRASLLLGALLMTLSVVACGGADDGGVEPELSDDQTAGGEFSGACAEGDAQGVIRCTAYALNDESQLTTQQRACESRDDSYHSFDWMADCPDGKLEGCEFPSGTAGIDGTVVEWSYFEGSTCRSPSFPVGEQAPDDMPEPDLDDADDEGNEPDDTPVNACQELSSFSASIEAAVTTFIDEYNACEADSDCGLVGTVTFCPNGSAYGKSYPVNLANEEAFDARVRALSETHCEGVPGDDYICGNLPLNDSVGCREGKCIEL